MAFWMTPQQTLEVGAIAMTWLIGFTDVCPDGWALASDGKY